MPKETHPPYTFLGDLASIVSGVIQNLNLQLVAGILDRTSCFDDPLDNVSFIEDGKLDGYGGKCVKMIDRPGKLALVAVVDKDEKIPMESVEYHGSQ